MKSFTLSAQWPQKALADRRLEICSQMETISCQHLSKPCEPQPHCLSACLAFYSNVETTSHQEMPYYCSENSKQHPKLQTTSQASTSRGLVLQTCSPAQSVISMYIPLLHLPSIAEAARSSSNQAETGVPTHAFFQRVENSDLVRITRQDVVLRDTHSKR